MMCVVEGSPTASAPVLELLDLHDRTLPRTEKPTEQENYQNMTGNVSFIL